ncbi:MAG: alpha/beta hydrolase [Proteobacteria bacterium]|nr:alpha/beta hydrolase [Pseudomonadota bacterium]
MRNEAGIWVEQGGTGETVFLLLHGRGCTGAVWRGVADIIEAENAGRWIAPDLPGHGRSAYRSSYSDGRYAADVATVVPDGAPVIVLGHSLGGVIALALATGWFGLNLRGAVISSVKHKWSDAEIEQARAVSRKPVHWFDNRAEAEERYLLVSGLKGLVEPDSPYVARGVAEGEQGFRLAADPMTMNRGAPPVAAFFSHISCPYVLGSGGDDAMAPIDELRELDAAAVAVPGTTHNLQVQDPAGFWSLVKPLL